MNKAKWTFVCLLFLALGLSTSSCEKSCSDTVWYRDVDGDGVGNLLDSLVDCSQPEGYVSEGGDLADLIVEAKQRVVIPYVGATWCPPCGSFGEDTKAYISENFSSDDAIIISSQRGTINPSRVNVAYQFGDAFMKEFGAAGIPWMFAAGGGDAYDFYPNTSVVDFRLPSILDLGPSVGIHADATLGATQVDVNVKVQFYEAKPTDYYVSVYLLEDDVRADQRHSTLGIVKDMPHNNILREGASNSNYHGQSIGSSFTANQAVKRSYQISLRPEWDANNLKVVAIVWEGTGTKIMNAHLVDL
ncbi:MAG: Omp28-related outer membrane protein [Bacteroidota bacterium]